MKTYLSSWIELLVENLPSAVNENGYNLYLGRYLNINMLQNSTIKLKFENMFELNNLLNVITCPSTVSSSTTQTDLFITSVDTSNVSYAKLCCDICVHLPVFMVAQNHISRNSLDLQEITVRELTLQIFGNIPITHCEHPVEWCTRVTMQMLEWSTIHVERYSKEYMKLLFCYNIIRPRKTSIIERHISRIHNQQFIHKQVNKTRNKETLSELLKI